MTPGAKGHMDTLQENLICNYSAITLKLHHTQGRYKITCTLILYDVMQSCSAACPHRRRLIYALNAFWRVSSKGKNANKLLLGQYTLLRVCTKQLWMRPCSLTENISECRLFVFSKSIKQLWPSAPWQTSALELLLFCYFHILLVLTITVYYTYEH